MSENDASHLPDNSRDRYVLALKALQDHRSLLLSWRGRLSQNADQLATLITQVYGLTTNVGHFRTPRLAPDVVTQALAADLRGSVTDLELTTGIWRMDTRMFSPFGPAEPAMAAKYVAIESPRKAPGSHNGYLQRIAMAPMPPIDVDRAVCPTILAYHDPELGLANWIHHPFADYVEGLVGVPLAGQTLWFGQRQFGERISGDDDLYQVSLVWHGEHFGRPAFYQVPIELRFDFDASEGEVMGDHITKNLHLRERDA